MKRRTIAGLVMTIALVAGIASAANAEFPTTPIRRCAADAVPAGAACLDKYEATVWRVPDPAAANAILVRRIQLGTATRADLTARGAMQLGAYYAGVAIENSMLGATHACANPLTARYGTAHGAAIAMLLPAVVRWNERVAGDDYAKLLSWSSVAGQQNDLTATEALARRLEQLAEAGGLRNNLRAEGISKSEITELASEAAEQWTGTFNPRPFDKQGAIEVYQCVY